MKKPFTQLENETMEALARAPLTAREFRVMLAVIRLTNGFHLTETKVPLKDLLLLTGLARNHLQATVKRLSQWQVVVANEDGLIACHGPALWRLPDRPKSGLSQIGPSRDYLSRQAGASTPAQVGTVPDRPKSGLSQIVPGPDIKTPALKKVQRKYKETLTGGPLKDEAPRAGSKDRKKRGGPGGGKPRHADAVEALVAVERAAEVKLVDRPKLLNALRRTLVAYPEAVPGDIADCFSRLGRDPWWGTKPPATLVMRLPDEFPRYWKLKSAGRVGEYAQPPPRGPRPSSPRQLPTGAELVEQARALGIPVPDMEE